MISGYNSVKDTLRDLLEKNGEVIDLCEYFPDMIGGVGYNELRYFSIGMNGEIEAESNNDHETEKGEDFYKSYVWEEMTDFEKIEICRLFSIIYDFPKANLSQSAKEKYGAKTDVIITSEDSLDHSKTTEGFSVKSHIGSPATLFNCSPTSGFTFEVVGCDEKGMHEINAKDTFLSIMEVIKEKYSLEYVGCRNEAFEQNIAFVDSRMEEVLSAAVLAHASYYGACGSNVKDVCNKVVELNPINVRNPQMFYSAKFKDFLFDSFAGMTASSLWNGRKRLTGGYIDVSRDGEMLYYRAMSDDIFGNYLFENTYFDRRDRGMCKNLAVAKANAYLEGRLLTESEENSYIYKNGVSGTKKNKKGDFGYVYEKHGQYFIDLNFQIRFR